MKTNNHPKFKVAFLLPGVGVIDRGAETFVLELSQRLEEKFDISIICRGQANHRCIHVGAFPRDLPLLQNSNRNKFIRKISDTLFLDPFGVESFSFSINALPILFRTDFDLIVSVSGIWGAMACRIIRRLKGTPFITIGQAGIGRPDLWQARQRPNTHVVLTEHAHTWIAKQCPDLNVNVIPNGIDLMRYHPGMQSIDCPLERPIYLCAAALVPYKNISCTIQAVAQLERGSLVVIGAGPLRHKIERLCVQQLGQNRFILKAVPYREMPAYYAACDVFTLVSEKECEAFGIVYLEAMACNKPVVATEDPIRTEIIGNGGILCDGHNFKEYAAALKRAAIDDFGDKPRRQAEKFSWDLITMQYQQLIERCVSANKG
jgi:glycosyltransferase involved in cell wall biosynthesis